MCYRVLLNVVIGNIDNCIVNLKILYVTYQYKKVSIMVRKRDSDHQKIHHVDILLTFIVENI